jgi:DNA-binding NtrC family response regulator
MLNYNWRGNVRELQHAIERAVLLSKKGVIENLDIPRTSENLASIEQVAEQAAAAHVGGNGVLQSSPSGAVGFVREIESLDDVGRLIVGKISDPEEGAEQKDIFNEIESSVVLAALKRTKGNKQAAAQLLGLYRPRLYGMIKRHNLEDKI